MRYGTNVSASSIASTAVRKAVTDCYVGSKVIHAGDQIFGPVRNWRLDGRYFGDNASGFDHTRWLNNNAIEKVKEDSRLSVAATHTAQGGIFAQAESYLFIAILLRRFDLEITTPEGVPIKNPQVPPVAVNYPAPAAMRP